MKKTRSITQQDFLDIIEDTMTNSASTLGTMGETFKVMASAALAVAAIFAKTGDVEIEEVVPEATEESGTRGILSPSLITEITEQVLRRAK